MNSDSSNQPTLQFPPNSTRSSAGSGESSDGSFHAALTRGSGQGLGSETLDLLRIRLRSVGVVLFAGLLLGFFQNLLFVSEPLMQSVHLAVIILVGLMTLLLFTSRALTRTAVRGMEVALLGSVSFFLAMAEHAVACRLFTAGRQELLLAYLQEQVVPFTLVILIYGMFIPNTWKRAAAVVVPIALVPLILRLVLRLEFPEFQLLVSVEDATSTLLPLAIAVGASVYGAHVISGLRLRAYEARQLGQYRLVEEIGVGGMGEVWKAKHRMLARPAAIKLIRPEMLGPGDPEMADTMLHRFEREAQATATLTSPHSVMIYDFGISDEGVFYYVMELLDGMDLYTLVSRFGPLPASRVIELLSQTCDSLADAHHRGLIHRDVKPGNIFTCRMGRRLDFVKVLDFGLVKESARTEPGTPVLTQIGATTGTPGFMAPEQALGQAVDPRSDLYALGCVGYWLLTAQFVFDQTNMTAMVLDHVKTPPVPPSQRSDKAIPEDLERVIMHCLEKEPDKRPRTAEELFEMLSACEDSGKWGQSEAREWWDANLPQQT